MSPALFTAALLAVVGLAHGKDFCAVRVRLLSPASRPAAVVELRDADGAVVERKFVRGEAEFCDFGFGEHSISVGGTTCGATVIPHVRLIFGKEQNFNVYLNTCMMAEDFVPRNCNVYFRVTDDSHKVPNVEILTTAVVASTDGFGRALVQMAVGDKERFVFRKEGYKTSALEIRCQTPSFLERAIRLDHVPAP